jgi:hypothetical protein
MRMLGMIRREIQFPTVRREIPPSFFLSSLTGMSSADDEGDGALVLCGITQRNLTTARDVQQVGAPRHHIKIRENYPLLSEFVSRFKARSAFTKFTECTRGLDFFR